MLKKVLSLTLILLVIGTVAVGRAYGQENKHQERAASKIKQKLNKFGLSAPVIVKATDGREWNGRLVEIADDRFVLLSGTPGDRIVIAYSEIKQVKYNGSTGGANLGPAFLVAGAVILLISLLR
jgi:hypothetical protein